MRELSFTSDKVSGVVREEIGRDVFNARGIYARIFTVNPDYEGYDSLLIAYAQCINQTISIDGLPFDLPKPTADGETLMAGFIQWQELPAAIVRKWTESIVEINKPPGDEDLFPPNALDQKKEVIPTS